MDNGSNNKKTEKKAFGFGKFINVFGIILLVIMLTFVGVNFARDARIFEKPLLTSETGKTNSSTTATDENKGTIKYKKPVSKSTSGSSSGNKKSSGSSKSKKTVTPTPTPNP